MSVYTLPLTHNGAINSTFNTNDYNPSQTTINSIKYVQLTGSTMTGPLYAVGLTSTNGFTTTGTNTFNTNITLPTAYNSAPNTALPSVTQLGGIITATASSTGAINNTITSITNITLLNYRIAVTATSSSSTTASFVIALSTTNNLLDANTRISYNCNSPYLALGGTNNESAFVGSYITTVSSSTTTLYLNYYASISGTLNSSGYIHAVRIALKNIYFHQYIRNLVLILS